MNKHIFKSTCECCVRYAWSSHTTCIYLPSYCSQHMRRFLRVYTKIPGLLVPTFFLPRYYLELFVICCRVTQHHITALKIFVIIWLYLRVYQLQKLLADNPLANHASCFGTVRVMFITYEYDSLVHTLRIIFKSCSFFFSEL
jgi:hypothetical protein